MVDRTIVYVGEIPLDTNILQPQRNTMVGLGALAQAVIGEQNASPAVAMDGFALTATGPASLVLNVGPGSIYAQGAVDQTAFGSLTADITDTITLQGISLSTTQLTFTPPGTGGFSTNYLVQVGLSVQDNTPVVLPYYNAANPPVPWLGPNNTGVSQNTVRQCLALIQAKAGIAATSGSQVTPAPDPGFFGLYFVTVANGATALTSGNFGPVANAPFIPSTLMAMPQAILSSKWIFSEDTGTANALVATLVPPPVALVDGMRVRVEKGASANNGPSTLNVNGTGTLAIQTLSGTALVGGEMPANSMLEFALGDGPAWQLQTVSPTFAGGPLFDGDATGTNAYVVSNLTPAAAGLTNRMMIKISFANSNTSASTLNIGFGAKPIVFANHNPLSGGEITDQHILSYNTSISSFELLTPTVPATVPPLLLVHYGTDTSVVVNAISAAMTPVPTSYGPGHLYSVDNIQLANTGGVTANFNGIGTRVVGAQDGTALLPGELQPGQSLVLTDTGSQLNVVGIRRPPGLPVFLTVSQTYYVDAVNGSDSNNGLAPGSGHAWQTIQHALSVFSGFNLNGFNVTLNCASGTYAPFVCNAINGSGTIFIIGNTTTPSAVLVSATTGEACLVTSSGYVITGMKFQSGADGSPPHKGAGVRAGGGTNVIVGNCEFGPCSYAHLDSETGSTITLQGIDNGFPSGFINVSGGATLSHMLAQVGGSIVLNHTALNITSAAGFGVGWAYALRSGVIFLPYTSITGAGSATGPRFNVTSNGVIDTAGSGISYFPGNSAGFADTANGGRYV